MEPIEKIATPRVINRNGWQVRLNRWIGWSYSEKHYCPFFWQTMLGLVLLLPLMAFRSSIFMMRRFIDLIAYIGFSTTKAMSFLFRNPLARGIGKLVNKGLVETSSYVRERKLVRAERKLQSLLTDPGAAAYFARLAIGEAAGPDRFVGKMRSTWRYDEDMLNLLRAQLAERNIEYAGFDVWGGTPEEYTANSTQRNEATRWAMDQSIAAEKEAAIIGACFSLIVLSFFTVMFGSNIGAGGLIVGLKTLAIVLTGLAGFALVVCAIVMGLPMIYWYFKDVVMEKYCPDIVWKDEDPE